MRIFELLGPTGQVTATEAELAAEFKKGLEAYRAAEWEVANQQFQRCVQMNPDDGPSALYIERIAKLRKEPPLPNWDGVWRLTKK